MKLQDALHEEYSKICKINGGVLVSTELSEDESYNIVKNAVERVIVNGHNQKSN